MKRKVTILIAVLAAGMAGYILGNLLEQDRQFDAGYRQAVQDMGKHPQAFE